MEETNERTNKQEEWEEVDVGVFGGQSVWDADTVNQSSGFNIYEGEILIKCHHKWRYMDCNSDNGMQTQRERGESHKS